MWISSWFRFLTFSPRQLRARSAKAKRWPHITLSLERLEDRTVPSAYMVTTTADSGAGSLRQAIQDANSNPGADSIIFDIAGSGVQTIAPLTPLPTITDPVTFDGTSSQSGASANTLASGDNAVLNIVLDGSNIGAQADGLTISAGGSAVQGLVIQNFYNGIHLTTNGNDLIAGNSFNNTFQGVFVDNVANNTVGGTVPAARNVIGFIDNGVVIQGAGATGNQVQGNYIGTDGSNVIGNVNQPSYAGLGVNIVDANDNFVGGTTAGAGNLIASAGDGIAIQNINASASGNLVQGNYIGPNADGSSLPSGLGSVGIVLTGNVSANVIGGTTAAARNVISGWHDLQVWFAYVAAPGGNMVEGNYIGTNAAGNAALVPSPNNGQDIGIWASASMNSAISGNLLSGLNGALVLVASPGCRVQGNLIGTDAAGSLAIPNNFGINVGSNNDLIGGTTPGAGNIIAFSNGPGIWVLGGTGASIEGNSIYGNSGLGIILGTDSNGDPLSVPLANDSLGHIGPNNFENYPMLNSATSSDTSTSVSGTFSEAAEPSTTITLDFYANASGSSTTYGQGQTYLGSRTVITDNTGNVSFSAALAVGNLANQWISATATDQNGNTSEFSLDIQATSASSQTFTQILPATLPQSTTGTNTLTIQANTTTISDVVTAISQGNLGPSVAEPISVYLNLAPGTYTATSVDIPAGMTLYINGVAGTQIDPASPAFMITSGKVVVANVTFVTTGNAPTILVTGGSLTLRNDTIQESAGGNAAAIAITGGTVDLGTTADPGGNVLNIHGVGELIHNAGANPVSALGNTFEVNGVTLTDPFAVEDKIYHALDAGGGGLVTYVAGNVYVTNNSGSIQRGVDAVAAGVTVNVGQGSYRDYNAGGKLLTVQFQNGPSLSQADDPDLPGKRSLTVHGWATGADMIVFDSGDGQGTVEVAINKLPCGTFAPTGRLIALGGAGLTDICVDDGIRLPAWLFAGSGNTRLQGGGGDNVLVGGAGTDELVGGSKRDLLIGGRGSSTLKANGGDDILISGSTSYDANDAALLAIMAEWTSADTFAQRVAYLSDAVNAGGFANRHNDNYFLLPDVTVFNDPNKDTLNGGAGRDWLFAAAADKIQGLTKSDDLVVFI
jgi:RTX calcium-binding nonapeptide repeat (4 copies)